jgi:hypothetical protein
MNAGRPRCSICRHPQLPEIQKCVIEKIPLDEIVFRFEGIKRSALHRHLSNHMRGTPTGKRATRGSGSGSHKRLAPFSRSATGDELSAEALKERALYQLECGERMMSMAEDANDARLVLASLDRTNRSLELMCKLAGLLKPDTVVVDNRSVNIYGSWPTTSLQALQIMHDELGAGKSVEEAIHAISSPDSTKPQLAPGRESEAA